MRALLIVNPRATATTPLRRDVIARALASELDLEVVETRYRGHATRLSASAASEGFGLVLTLGGDGTVNEAINGIMNAAAGTRATATGTGADTATGTGADTANETGADTSTGTGAGATSTGASRPANAGASGSADADGQPALAAIPGGSANVFTRALGLSPDPVDATGRILDSLLRGEYRRIGLGQAAGRYFAFNAGLGFDAEVVRAVEGRRAVGIPASAPLYFWTAVRHFFTVTDRRHPALTAEIPGHEPDARLFLCIVSNAAPWTFLGRRPVNPSPEADFEAGLDLFAFRTLGTVQTLTALLRMLSRNGGPRGRRVLALHDLPGLTIRATRPVAFQVDGEYVGEAEQVTFTSVPRALRVLA